MIARCDRCDADAIRRDVSIIGFRWDPERWGLGGWRCPRCKGELRGKRKGDTEALILDAEYVGIPR